MKRKASDELGRLSSQGSRRTGSDAKRHCDGLEERSVGRGKTPTRPNEPPAPALNGSLAGTKISQPNGGGEPNTIETNRERENANELYQALVLLITAVRLAAQNRECPQLSKRYQAHLSTVCELAMREDVMENPHLDAIPINWFGACEQLHICRKQTKELIEKHRSCLDELAQAEDAVDGAILQRTKILLSSEANCIWTDAVYEQDRLAKAKRRDLEEAKGNSRTLEYQIMKNWQEEERVATVPLYMAEDTLVHIGLLPARQSQQPNERADKPRKDDAQSLRVDENERPIRRTERQASPTRADHRRPAPDMKAHTRERMRQEWKDAMRVRSEVSRDREQGRNRYYENLAEFLDARIAGKIEGTKTDFDRGYFLEQIKATHEISMAERRLDFAEREAQRTGALRLHELTSNFGEWPGDDEAHSVYDDPVWDTKKQEIEEWRTNKQQEDIVIETKWHVEMSSRGDEGKSIKSASDIGPEDLAEGKRKELLDKWKAHQEKLRATPCFIRLPEEGPDLVEADEPFWFQECCGV